MTTATAPRAPLNRSGGPLSSGAANTREAWASLAPAAAELRQSPQSPQSPQNHDLRVKLAADLAHLGLVTLASAALAALPEAAQARDEVKAIRTLITAAPDDLLDPALLEATCRANIDSMAQSSGEAAAAAARALEPWVQRVQTEQWYRAADGNVVRRDRDEPSPWLWRGLSEQKAAAEAFAAKIGAAQPLPITLEGADPPWLLAALATAPARADGHMVRVNLVQADPLELLDGLALVDLREALASGRAPVFCGEQASAQLAARLRQRMDLRIKGISIGLPRVGRPASPPVGPVLEQVAAEQEAQHRALVARTGQRYAGRDRAWWAQRYREARSGAGGAPLRVLLPSCRYSTFVKHAAQALEASFTRAGYRAEILIEPDDFSHLSTIAYLRAFEKLEPDLIVLINYTRSHMGAALPRNVPFVTWIQDAMAHLLDPATGAAQGEFDYLVGHLLPELFDQFGYPRQRALSAPVVADAEKFHPGPIAPELRRQYQCEVALVSHHGEPPEALHHRLVASVNADPQIARVCSALRPRIEEIVRSARDVQPYHAITDAVAEETGALPPAIRQRAQAVIFRQYALPMADRIFRHETLAWAADICEREGWRLHIYGRGWSGGRFDRCARGEVPHGEELRACYQAAGAHLHASINTAVHQRVMECALSGGLPLVRLDRGLATAHLARAHAAVARRGGMERVDGVWTAAAADHPEYLAAAAQLQRLGHPPRARFNLRPDLYERLRQEGGGEDASPEATELLGDLSVCGFLDRDGLEARLRQAIERPAWRAAAGEGIAARVRARWTTDVLAGEIVELVEEGLSG